MPKADWILFGSADGQVQECDAIARWEKVEKVVGHRMEPTDYCPPRFYIEHYPIADELTELGLAKSCPKNVFVD